MIRTRPSPARDGANAGRERGGSRGVDLPTSPNPQTRAAFAASFAMPVNLLPPSPRELNPIPGLSLGTAMAGVRKANRRDVTVVTFDAGTSVAGVFTANRFCAAPVQLCREHLAAGGDVRAILVNTGNANAGTGADGLARARSTCAALAALLGCRPEQVLPFSTGVIMETLRNDRIEAALPAALANAQPDHWALAAEAIMTTDTVPKAASTSLSIGGRTVAITGISKGAGMIRPNMATMLGFIATDAAIAPGLVQQLVREAADESFNRITIDGDTSTNDSFVPVSTHGGIVGRGVAVDRDTVERLVGRFAHELLHEAGGNGGIGGDETEHRRHVRPDHPGALAYASHGHR